MQRNLSSPTPRRRICLPLLPQTALFRVRLRMLHCHKDCSYAGKATRVPLNCVSECVPYRVWRQRTVLYTMPPQLYSCMQQIVANGKLYHLHMTGQRNTRLAQLGVPSRRATCSRHMETCHRPCQPMVVQSVCFRIPSPPCSAPNQMVSLTPNLR